MFVVLSVASIVETGKKKKGLSHTENNFILSIILTNHVCLYFVLGFVKKDAEYGPTEKDADWLCAWPWPPVLPATAALPAKLPPSCPCP
ncbi:hypothetical protein NQ314_012360 [Rhamnusium bicolor]|uniref:Uncharacterized protein n=1 Tax=Rhamnusium bicolor TaxID=1586634 RepID=A0AAV8XC40_9CUCU|nr:hypothetical protein NQ314_012360 [Rhamnusium bicolor]